VTAIIGVPFFLAAVAEARVISFSHVSVRYRGNRLRALDDVSIAAPAGRLTAVVGPNGSGKSTLVRALVGQVPLEQGSIAVDDQLRSRRRARALARRVAVVTQREEPAFPLGVRDYVALGRYPHLGCGAARRRSTPTRSPAAVARTEIEPYLDRTITELSGGEWQRVRLGARARPGRSIAGARRAHDLSSTSARDGGVRAARPPRRRWPGGAAREPSAQSRRALRPPHGALHRGRVAGEGTPADVMQASLLESLYDWPLVVARDPAVGAPALIPLRSRPRA
jgi:iron complex transport system ATP-binding protein